MKRVLVYFSLTLLVAVSSLGYDSRREKWASKGVDFGDTYANGFLRKFSRLANISQIPEYLIKPRTKEGIYFWLKPQNLIVVKGEVKKTGEFRCDLAKCTLGDYIEKAGGITVFGLRYRVRVSRYDKQFIYDLRKVKYQKIKIFAGDIISVPQESMFGEIHTE